ncbi:T9SS type A sorting domain-containing protein [bacterium]|nr:T9SS type A sorting domain-containing protein [bacterium]
MRRNIVLILTLALFVVAGAFASAPQELKRTAFNIAPPTSGSNELDEVVWIEDFEGDVSDWTQASPDVQPTWWQTDDWMPAGGTNAWRCFDPDFGSGTFGGYNDDWLQFLMTPALDWSGVSSASLSFDFRAYIEDGNWDAANVWVLYGDDPNNLTYEIATPTAPAYTETDCQTFDPWFGTGVYPGWAGEGTEPFNTAYQAASFNLNAYTGFDYVHIVFCFSSDGAYNSSTNPDMFGFQVDNIVVTADASTVWADDADGNNIGGAPEFLTGAAAAGSDVLPYQIEIDTCPVAYQPAPSPTTVAGVFQDADEAFNHYLEGPEFSLADLDPGQSYWLDVYFNSDIEYTNNFPDELAWRPEIYNPTNGSWNPAATTGNYVYVGGNGSVWEMFSGSGFTYDWDMSAYAGMTGLRLRFYFTSPAIDRTMTHHLWDDLFIDRQDLQHDISTVMVLPYPTSVGVDVYGKVYLTNNGPNDETGFNAVWDLDGLVYPLYPTGTYSLNAGETLELSIDDPTAPEVGYWVPETMGALALDAYHTLASDEVPDNDNFPVDVDVMADDMYEVGTDSRNFFGLLSAGHVNNEGPTVHIDPTAINGDMFPAGATFDIAELRMDGFFHANAGGAPANCEMDFIVYAGGDTPGAQIFQGTYTFTEATGYTGGTQAVLDVSGAAALQGLSGDFWVEARLTTEGLDGYMQPFPYQTGTNSYFDVTTQFYTYEDAVNGDNLTEDQYGHHVTAVLTNVSQATAVLELTPQTQFVPAGGGNLNYDIHFQNNTGGSFNGVDYWTRAMLPNGNMTGLLAPPLSFNVTPFMNANVTRTIQVPGGAPNGVYTFFGYVGFYPQPPVLTDSFQFQKGNTTDSFDYSDFDEFGEAFMIAGEDVVAGTLPTEFSISEAYPNPFNPTTTLSVSLPEAADLKVTVFNVMGQQVATIANSTFDAGMHTLTFDGAGLASGLYFIQAQVPGQLNELRKVTLMK